MPEEPQLPWRGALDIAVEAVSAEQFCGNLSWLREECGDDPDEVGMAYAYLLANWFVESSSLFATLRLPPEEVPAALGEIRETLAHLDFDEGQRRLKRHERRYYDRFAQIAAPLFTELGEAMEALFNCYVAGDYDPDANPDELIAEALETAEDDLERAHHLIAQAGAIALHSHPLWWRWQIEADGPARPWLVTMANLVEDYTGGGKMVLGSLEQARADAETSLREVEERPESPAAEPSPVDELIEELIEQGEEPFTQEQLELCQAHREEAIPALIDLVEDEELQMEDSPGEGYAPIHAVQLLGELQAVEAIPALIDIVADVDMEAIISDTALYALKQIGQPALKPVLTFMRYSWNVEVKVKLAELFSAVGQGDEQAYQALVAVWEEATWEEGKCLLAYPLAQTGGEQAIPLLEAALEDPDLDNVLDYNEIACALEELGVEAPPPPSDLETLDFELDLGIGGFARSILLETGDPENLMTFADMAPKEWHSRPDGLAHAYTVVERHRLNSLIAMQAIILPSGISLPLTADLLEAVEALTFDATIKDYPRWLRKTYNHLAECAGPDLQLHLAGVLLSLQHYLSEDYDIADDPDQLLAAARELPPDDEKLRQLFGQAGALVLHGRTLWPRWPDEADRPLSGWLEGLIEFRRPLERIGQIPLRPSPETGPEELSATLTEALEREREEPPPPVAKLLDLLIAQKNDTLPPAQRRRFAHQRAAVIPHLIRIVEDRRYWYEDGPGEGWAAILAIRLLGELKATHAADALVSAVADSRPGDIINDAALFSLMVIGRPALSAVQAYFRYGRDIETKTSLAEVLGHVGRRSKDSFDLLRQVWEAADWRQNRRMVALAFGDLRDRRAIPLLKAALDDRSADALDSDYIHWALQQLGTPVPPAEKKSPRLKTTAPYNPRLIYDELDNTQRLRYTTWGEPLCPDCGQPLVWDESGEWTHSPEPPVHRPASRRRKRKKKRRQ
ncbi:MAG: HEAT repeat domain-containing protein [Anaerolineae bacterium]